jgi:hypothetical protein
VPRATPCFTDYAEKACDSREPARGNEIALALHHLETVLLADNDFIGKSSELRDWLEKLNTFPADSEERRVHMRCLFRKGLSNEADSNVFYSFCLKKWVQEEDYRHCTVCSNCYSVHQSWHCGVCKQCRHSGLDVPCQGCGGTSSRAELRPEVLRESSRIRIGIPEPDETPYPQGLSATQSVVGHRVAGSLHNDTANLGSTAGDEVNPFEARNLSQTRDPFDEDREAIIPWLSTPFSSTFIAERRAENIRGRDSFTDAVPPPLTTGNLKLLTHDDSTCESASRSQDVLDNSERSDTEIFHVTARIPQNSGCVCTDGCRSSTCACASSGKLCSNHCSCRNENRLCDNSPKIRTHPALRIYYFGTVAALPDVNFEFHRCFQSRLDAVASGEIGMERIQDGSYESRCGVISGKELSMMKEVPDVRRIEGIEGQFTSWRDTPHDVRQAAGHLHTQWLFRRALSKKYYERYGWRFSFCQSKWINLEEWMHCTRCHRCHTLKDASERCWE